MLVGSGVLANLRDLLDQYCPASRYAIITDAEVGRLYADRVRSVTGPARCSVASFPAGEASKTRETWGRLTDRLLADGVGRDGAIIALGGGVVGDVAGFVAATYMRGIPCVQLPTTLLAMIDSSVGGKTGVDTSAGKNLVGAFHQPRLVIADVDTLSTLPDAELTAGMAEALKHGAIADRPYFERLSSTREKLLARDTQALTDAVAASVRIKAGVVGRDEREQGERAVLNFGHTVGHAVEAASNYTLLHGQAIAIGMVAEAKIGVRLGLTEEPDANLLASVIELFGLPARIAGIAPATRLFETMRHDKKSRGGEIRLSLIRKIGEPARGSKDEWTIPVSTKVLEEALGQLS